MTERLPYRLPRDVVPEHYSLVLEPDLSEATFEGAVGVELRVVNATSEILLNANELQISHARLVTGDGSELTPAVEYRPDEQQLALALPRRLEPGESRLELRFSGKLNDLLHGFYRSKFKDQAGKERLVAVTQFEVLKKKAPTRIKRMMIASLIATITLFTDAESRMPMTSSVLIKAMTKAAGKLKIAPVCVQCPLTGSKAKGALAYAEEMWRPMSLRKLTT